MRAAARRLVVAPGGWPIHLLLAALLVPRASFLGEALFDRDLHGQWYPRALAFAQAARERLPPALGHVDRLRPAVAGRPSAQLLYPTTWLGAVLAPWTLYTLYAIGHLALAGAGMTRLARVSGLRRTESLVAGVAFLLWGRSSRS